MKQRQRIISWDVIRTVAILLVLICHATEACYPMLAKNWSAMAFTSQIFRTVGFTAGRLGVPIFLFLSGGLLLTKKMENDEDCLSFYKRNLLPLFITCEIWICLYNIFLAVFNNTPFDFTLLIRNLLFLEPIPISHIWYIPTIIGLYLAIPFISAVLKRFSIKSMWIFMVIAVLFLFVVPAIDSTKRILGSDHTFFTIIDLGFSGGIYGVYLVLGYFLKNGLLKKIPAPLLAFIGTIAFGGTCIYQMWSYNVNRNYYVWYDFMGIVITATCIFEVLSRIDISEKRKVVRAFFTKISVYSLGIYFLHKPIMMILQRVFPLYGLHNPLRVMLLLSATFILSFIPVYFLCKIKPIGKLLFLAKE